MTNFKMTVRADCAVLHVAPLLPTYTPLKLLFKSSCPLIGGEGVGRIGLWTGVCPSPCPDACHWNKANFPFYQQVPLLVLAIKRPVARLRFSNNYKLPNQQQQGMTAGELWSC